MNNSSKIYLLQVLLCLLFWYFSLNVTKFIYFLKSNEKRKSLLLKISNFLLVLELNKLKYVFDSIFNSDIPDGLLNWFTINIIFVIFLRIPLLDSVSYLLHCFFCLILYFLFYIFKKLFYKIYIFIKEFFKNIK